MTPWQISFFFLPSNLVGEGGNVPEQMFQTFPSGTALKPASLCIPSDYEQRLSALLPRQPNLSPEVELWGNPESDNIVVSKEAENSTSIWLQMDLRKNDDVLLAQLLALAKEWSCVLVEKKSWKIWPKHLPAFRDLITHHPQNRALKDPKAWLPILSDSPQLRKDAF